MILTVKTEQQLRTRPDRFLGINLNYIRDADANRPGVTSLTTALKTLKVRWLRYPGGEKSDHGLWAAPPYTTPKPTSLGWYATVQGVRINIDQYIAVARAVGAEPYIVVGYDSLANSGRTQTQWREHAVSLVRYANITKGYGVKYWEIGNENWNNKTASGSAMAKVVLDFARAMKAVDPSIQLVASGSGSAWWSTFLPIAAPALHYLSVSLYNAWDWGSYAPFTKSPTPDLIGEVRTAASAITTYAPSAERARLQILVSETNSIDWSNGGWPQTNTLGHAVVTCDTLGRLLQHPKVRAALVWTTRWMTDAEASTSQWYALGPTNNICPTGRALQVWGQFLQTSLVAVTGGTAQVSGYASRTSTGTTLTVWIMNRGYPTVTDVRVAIHSARTYAPTAEIYQLRGTGSEDVAPRWGKVGNAIVSGNTVSGFTCPGVSVTVLRCRAV